MTSNGSNEDCCSPEHLFTSEAAKDPYSTDEEQEPKKKSRRMCKKESSCQDRESNKDTTGIALTNINNGSELKAEQSYFYQNVHFQKIEEEVSLENKSICECLEFLFKFSSSKFFDDQKCTWKGETIVDLLNREMKATMFNWFAENDNIDWKTASPEERLEIQEFHVKSTLDTSLNYVFRDRVLNVADKIRVLYDELDWNNCMGTKEEKHRRHNVVRRCIESIGSCLCPLYYIPSVDCRSETSLYIPETLVSDTSSLIPDGRQVLIRNEPNGGVFTFPYSLFNGKVVEKLWLIPVQIYNPSTEKESEECHRISSVLNPQNKDIPTCGKSKHQIIKSGLNKDSKQMKEHFTSRDCSPPKTSKYSLKINEVLSSKKNCCLPPRSSKDGLLNSIIQDNLQKKDYSSPRNCYSPPKTSKDVLLNSMVKDRGLLKRKDYSCYLPPKTSKDSLLDSIYVEDVRKYITEALPIQCCGNPHCCDKIAGEHVQQLIAAATQIITLQKSVFDLGIINILGLFIVNEYVYFSRLDIQKEIIHYYSGVPYSVSVGSSDDCHSFRQNVYEAFKCLKMPSVTFSNFRLDLTVAKHRLALMIFVRNYQQAFFNTKL